MSFTCMFSLQSIITTNFVISRMAFIIIQRNIRKWLSLRTWIWWKIYTRVKPLLSIARAEDEQKKLQEEFEKTKEELEKTEKKAKALEEQNVTLQQQKNDMFLQLQVGKVFILS